MEIYPDSLNKVQAAHHVLHQLGVKITPENVEIIVEKLRNQERISKKEGFATALELQGEVLEKNGLLPYVANE